MFFASQWRVSTCMSPMIFLRVGMSSGSSKLTFAAAEPVKLAALARTAAQAFHDAAGARRTLPRAAAPALFPGPAPMQALQAIMAGEPPDIPSDFNRRAALARLALTGRWWV